MNIQSRAWGTVASLVFTIAIPSLTYALFFIPMKNVWMWVISVGLILSIGAAWSFIGQTLQSYGQRYTTMPATWIMPLVAIVAFFFAIIAVSANVPEQLLALVWSLLGILVISCLVSNVMRTNLFFGVMLLTVQLMLGIIVYLLCSLIWELISAERRNSKQAE
jgi:hypothetical protein